jgi:hypothetical protein
MKCPTSKRAHFETLEERRHMSATRVALRVADPTAGEGGPDGATFVVSRSQALPTTTRVFLSVGGTARSPAFSVTSRDYDLFGATVPGTTSTSVPTLGTRGQTPYVDIYPGRTSTTVILATREDAIVEATETATFKIVPSSAYVVDSVSSGTIRISDNDFLTDFRVNFQTAGVAPPPGYAPDTGAVFGERGPGYTFGWSSDNTANARVRNNPQSPDARYDSFNVLPFGLNRKWEIAVPNGTYQVRVVTGDPDSTDGNYGVWIEDQLGAGGRPNGVVRFFRTTGVVSVADGRLTLLGALGSSNNKLDFIDIKRLPLRSKLGPIANVSAPLKVPETAGWWHEQPNGLFSDTQMDEALWS